VYFPVNFPHPFRIGPYLVRSPEGGRHATAGMPPRWFWRRAGEIGILGIGVPAEYGGLPDSTLKHSAVVTEEARLQCCLR